MLFFFFYLVNSIYIVQTNNSSLHFILNDSTHKIKIPVKPQHKLGVEGEFVKSIETEVVLSSRDYLDTIEISPDGNILIENQSFNIDSIIDKPKIVNNIIFQTQKKCVTARLFDIVIFVVFLELQIVDSRTMCRREQHFSYIYHPFSASENVEVLGNTVCLNEKEYKFDEEVIAVYNTKYINGVRYMVRIYNSTQIERYQPRLEKKYSYKLYLIIPTIIFLIYLLKRKQVLFVKTVEEHKLYILYEGKFINKRVLIKWYRKHTPIATQEINLLHKLNNPHIPKILFYENSWFSTFLIFEYSEILQNPSKDQLQQIVKAVKYLNGKSIHYKNFSPQSIRVINEKIVLFDIGVPQENTEWYISREDDLEIREVMSLGCLLHYYITGYHPFDLENISFIKAPSFETNLIAVSAIDKQTYSEIENNILLKRYKIRCEDPLIHDLIYHCIKNKCEDLTSISRLANHPFFWKPSTTFEFIANYSDLLEICPNESKKLERNKGRIFKGRWSDSLEEIIETELSVFRTYNYSSAKDLIRVIRNKGRHYSQIPPSVKEIYKGFPDGLISYWINLFPGLVIVCYNCGYSLRENELLRDFY